MRVGALLEHLHLQPVLLLAEEHAVGDVDGVPGEAALVRSCPGLASVDGDTRLGEDGLEHQLYLPARPCLGQGELGLV